MEEREIQNTLLKIKKNLESFQEQSTTFKTSINQDYRVLDQILGGLAAQKKELKELRELLVKEQEIKFKNQITDLSRTITNFQNLLSPRTGSLFVRLFLGKVNVKHYREGERRALKEEYQKFKRKTDFLFLAFTVVQYFDFKPLETLFQTWLLYYYTTLALRENILKVNGSNINQWWIVQHYLSIGVSLTVLTWTPNSPHYHQYQELFFYLCSVQSIVQILQTQYQSSKLYKMIAMGKADTMDVTGDHTDLGMTAYVSFLLPFLLGIQGLQSVSYTHLTLPTT
eukprot:TRINITY_DN11287_c0_g1_i1.p1 TRINITY_DN11287_c0_g1~~TRINITY_DN11287_c0_g1_i1.p1  ORF type:complete len:296 (-),score=62.42 TRINITY_DN11287_c0_g1_i1:9-857(-)